MLVEFKRKKKKKKREGEEKNSKLMSMDILNVNFPLSTFDHFKKLYAIQALVILANNFPEGFS